MDISRFMFNSTFDFIRSCQNFTPSWMDIKKYSTAFAPEFTKNVPFQIKGIAIKDACDAFWKANGHPKFRKRKDLDQSCFIPKSALSKNGIYPRISGKGLKFSESLPESLCDSRLIWRSGKWFIAVPSKQHVSYADNQGRVVAIDPGVRSFATYFSADSCGFIGKGDFSRIQRLACHADELSSRMDLCKNKQRKFRMRLARARMFDKIRALISELHHKTALFLVKNYDCILLPTFETSQMAGKIGRKIRSKTVRSLLTFSHYKFKIFLKHKAFESGKTVLDVCEAYTSKTHPETGEIKNVGSAKRIKCSSGWVNRDIIGARNILLRALVDQPDYFKAITVN